MNALFMSFQDLNCLFLCAGNLRLPPAAGATAFVMLHEEVTAPDLVFSLPTNIIVGCCRMMSRHVFLECLGIGVRRRFPA